MSDKLKVTETLGVIELRSLELSFENMLFIIEQYIQRYGGNSYLVYDNWRWFDYDERPTPCYQIRRDRFETAEEEQKRLEILNQCKEREVEKDKRTFENLKNKHGW